MMREKSALKAHGIAKQKGSKRLWSNVSFELARGESIAITGSSGAGKTTLLNCLGLLETPDSGSLTFDGRAIDARNERQRIHFFREYVGFVFQNYALVEPWTVKHNLNLALTFSGMSRRDRSGAVSASLERLGLSGRENAKVYTLSGGEQQRVALARLLLKKPRLILADEPLAALDDDTSEMVKSIFSECCEMGAALAFTTHNSLHAAIADTAIHLSTTSESLVSSADAVETATADKQA